MKVLVFLDYYLPGYKAGGPPRTIANMVHCLSDRLEFWILTRDHDLTESTPYVNVSINDWNRVGQARVYYASSRSLSLVNLQRLVKQVSADAIYLNSFFSPLAIKLLVLRRLGLVPKVPVILAPRGELSPGALSLGAAKKKFYLTIALQVGLYRNVVWQASAELERQEIQRIVGSHTDIHIAANIPTQVPKGEFDWSFKPVKVSGVVRLVFLSRISAKKNLSQILETLCPLSGQIQFDIYGPVDDQPYWQRCEDAITRMPPNVRVNYCGPLPPTQVTEVLTGYHFFVLPTLGENFGHVILEALTARCPVLISDQTPWRDLPAKRAGWDLPLDDASLWQEVLQQCIDMDESTYTGLSQAARQFALDWIGDSHREQDNIDLFKRALER